MTKIRIPIDIAGVEYILRSHVYGFEYGRETLSTRDGEEALRWRLAGDYQTLAGALKGIANHQIRECGATTIHDACLAAGKAVSDLAKLVGDAQGLDKS